MVGSYSSRPSQARRAPSRPLGRCPPPPFILEREVYLVGIEVLIERSSTPHSEHSSPEKPGSGIYTRTGSFMSLEQPDKTSGSL